MAAKAALDSDPSQQQWLALQEARAVMRNSLVKEEAYWREKNTELQRLPSMEEIKDVVFAMDRESAAGPDGLIHSYWGFTPFRVPRGCPPITHLTYADDIIVFSSRLRQSMRLVMKALDAYVSVSGQKVNQQKSCVLAHANFIGSRKWSIAKMTGFQSKEFPVRYLGYPLYAGRRKRCYFAGICDSVTIPQTLGRASIGLSGPSCATRMTGGAGLRSLKHVFDAFSMRLWWHFRLRQLLWVEFMHCKYCSNLHPSFADTSPGDSWTWKRLVAIQGVAEQHIYWVLARGNRLSRVAPSGWVGRMLGVMPPSLDQADTMVWAPSTSGVFSLASANRIARENGNSSWLYSLLWLQGQPTKISFFMSRLVGSYLLVMGKLHKLGIFGPSCCGYCLHPFQESSDHIFYTGEAAKRIWGYFEGVIGGFQESSTIRHKLVSWWLKPTRNPYLQYLFRLLLSLICWNLWQMRNSFVFDGHLRPMAHVCAAIF
nr:uncharacterized protein LOC113706014 [Coffea arabica]